MTIPVDFGQANLRFTGLLVPTGAEVTMGFDVSNYAGTVAEAALDVGEAWITHLMPNLSDQLVLSSVMMKFGPDATGPSSEQGMAVNAGGDTAAAASPNVTYLIRKQTALGGRAGRGRIYVPGVVENAITSAGNVETGKRGALQADIEAWGVALSTLFLFPVVLHGAGSPVTVPTPITGWDVDLQAATQRRRLRR